MKIDDHPTVVRLRTRPRKATTPGPVPIDWLRQACLDAGADDVGFVEITRPAIADQRADIEEALPGARTLVSFVVRMNPDDIRSPFRSLANTEFHHGGDHSNEVARRIVERLRERGARAVNPAMGFPMEMDRFPGKIWVVSHKPVAQAAGLGTMGIHRNVIHPRLGNFILLGTVITDAEVTESSQPIDFNPCLSCKLCVAACPVGAIKPDGAFDFGACYTHNYREFMSGFTDFTEQLVEARSVRDKRRRIKDEESASMWQSLSYGANYKAAYCMAVCPAGEEVIEPFLADRKAFVGDVVRPLQRKEEPVYVVADSDAEDHVRKRFPHKTVRVVRNALRPTSAVGFLRALPLVFQAGKAEGLQARYHFTFTGSDPCEGTVVIEDGRVVVEEGLVGEADLSIRADADVWLGFLAKERSMVWALLNRSIVVTGPLRLMRAFARCFPS